MSMYNNEIKFIQNQLLYLVFGIIDQPYIYEYEVTDKEVVTKKVNCDKETMKNFIKNRLDAIYDLEVIYEIAKLEHTRIHDPLGFYLRIIQPGWCCVHPQIKKYFDKRLDRYDAHEKLFEMFHDPKFAEKYLHKRK
jgi:hypothetical protein